MDLGLRDKVIMISGASRGIGRATAHGFAEEGCRLSLCARGMEGLERVVHELQKTNVAILALPIDVTKKEDRHRWSEETLKRFGRIDVLINNAGGSRSGDLLAVTEEDWQAVFDLNLFAAVQLCRLVVPLMQKQGAGAIVNISSIYGREWGGTITYNASKVGLISFSKMLARELAPSGIRVNTVAPGSILFPGGSWDRRRNENPQAIAAFVKSELPFGRFGTAEEVANMVVFLASPRASWISGACVTVDGCQSRSLI